VRALGRWLSVGWRLPLVALALLAIEAGVAIARHTSDEELRWKVARGDREERIEALRLLANRGAPDASLFGDELVRSLLASGDDHLAEFAFTHEIDKFGDSRVQARHVYHYAGYDFAHWWRAYVLHSAKVEGGPRLTLQALRWWFGALADEPPPVAEARRSIVIARALAERRRIALGTANEE
jgi:hypothetical protein